MRRDNIVIAQRTGIASLFPSFFGIFDHIESRRGKSCQRNIGFFQKKKKQLSYRKSKDNTDIWNVFYGTPL